MARVIPIFYFTCIILVNIIFSNFVESAFLKPQNNATNHASQWGSGRSKRSLINTLPTRLTLKVKYENELIADLIWSMKRHQYLANEHLPVVMPLANLNPNVMENVGEFVVYHDIKRCSAVVYFDKLKAFYGVIGTDYYIAALPYNFDENGEYQLEAAAKPFILKREHPFPHIFPDRVLPPPFDADAWREYTRTPMSDLNLSRKRSIECFAGPSTKTPRTEQDDNDNMDNDFDKYQDYHSETLVLVTRDIAENFKQQYGDEHIEWIVRYYIVYFNAVDMIFRKLQLGKLGFHINIAKIIIEDELIPFEFMSNDELQFNEIVSKLPNYMTAFPSEYFPDSFDHVFISTSRPIFDDDFQVNGMTKYGADMYEARKRNEFYTVVPITITRFQHLYADYIVAVHQVARTLNMKVDPHENGLISIGQCHGIMQREGPRCINCLKWSDDSKKQYAEFFNRNRNRCFLMNTPWSIRPRGVSRSVSTTRQCQCFGYDSTPTPKDVGFRGCNLPLRCERKVNRGGFVRENTVLPFDGSPCTDRKVCWERKCQLVSSS